MARTAKQIGTELSNAADDLQQDAIGLWMQRRYSVRAHRKTKRALSEVLSLMIELDELRPLPKLKSRCKA